MRLLASNHPAKGFAVRLTGTATGKDLVEFADFFRQFALFQGTQSGPDHFGAVIVSPRRNHSILLTDFGSVASCS